MLINGEIRFSTSKHIINCHQLDISHILNASLHFENRSETMLLAKNAFHTLRLLCLFRVCKLKPIRTAILFCSTEVLFTLLSTEPNNDFCLFTI